MPTPTPTTPLTPRQALRAYGYQELRPGEWLKPVGYGLFAYSELKQEWSVWFAGAADGSTKLWCRRSLSEDDLPEGYTFLERLKYHEVWDRHEFKHPSHFEIVTPAVLADL